MSTRTPIPGNTVLPFLHISFNIYLSISLAKYRKFNLKMLKYPSDRLFCILIEGINFYSQKYCSHFCIHMKTLNIISLFNPVLLLWGFCFSVVETRAKGEILKFKIIVITFPSCNDQSLDKLSRGHIPKYI